MFIVKMSDHVEKNVPITRNLPSRWQDGAENLGLEHLLFLLVGYLSFLLKERRVNICTVCSNEYSVYFTTHY